MCEIHQTSSSSCYGRCRQFIADSLSFGKYFLTFKFFRLFNEGFYLHSRITVQIFNSEAPVLFFNLIGWGEFIMTMCLLNSVAHSSGAPHLCDSMGGYDGDGAVAGEDPGVLDGSAPRTWLLLDWVVRVFLSFLPHCSPHAGCLYCE